jgi:hypothetical protein
MRSIQIGVYLTVFLIFCLLNAALLRFAADIVVKRMPSFKTAFCLSIITSIALILSNRIAFWLGTPRGGSLLAGGSSAVIDSPLISILPLPMFLLAGWILNSNYIADAESNFIGYGKGAAVTAVQCAFLLVIGLLIGIAVVFRGFGS